MTTPAPFHVLIIEDSPDDRADLRQMLLHGSSRHYAFTEAATGTAGIRAVLDPQATPPDCVLLDYNLPDMDALAVLAALHAGGEVTVCPVVVVTVSLERGALALRAGAQEFLGKSWAMPESVTRAIDSAVERHVASRRRLANEAALRQNAALFSKIIELAPGGVYVMDAQLRMREVNTEALPVFASVLPVIGRELGEVMEVLWGPEMGRELTAIFRRTLETGERYASPRFEHLRHDLGVEQVYDWETQRITLPDGQHGVVCYFQDVTARERAAEAQRLSEERYRALMTASSAAVYRMSADWSEILDLNGQGFVADTTPPGVNWVEEYLYPEDQPQVLAAIREAIRTKGHFVMEHRVRRVDGSVGWTSTHAIPLLNAKGEIIEWFGAANDITERQLAADGLREAKEAAEAANQSKDRFLAALSHELRTPLTPILLVSGVHAKSKKLSKDLREDFEMIHRNIVLEAQLIDDLLDVSRIQQGKMRFDFDLVDVHDGIAHSLEMLRAEIEEKSIAVRQELSATPATLEADAARLRQVLCNLLRNAVKFTAPGGTITVRTVREIGGLNISVSDTGTGIAAENLERIFQPFEQVDAQRHGEDRSLGLGLAISGAIVAAHRGRIWAESPGLGYGSTLHVRLPS